MSASGFYFVRLNPEIQSFSAKLLMPILPDLPF